MPDPQIVCPTHGRAGRVSTFRVLPDLTLCVSESQHPLYAEKYPDADYLVHPNSVVGLAPKRQWIQEHFGAKNEDVMMLDDDITSFLDKAQEPTGVCGPGETRDHVKRLFSTAEQMGVYLVGFSNTSEPLHYSPMNPFRLSGFVGGHSLGLRAGHNLWFHPDLLEDDWWISLLNAHYHRMCLIDDRFSFAQSKTFKNKGGLAQHRTVGHLRNDHKVLREHFGPVLKAKKGPANRQHSRAHDAQQRLQLPF